MLCAGVRRVGKGKRHAKAQNRKECSTWRFAALRELFEQFASGYRGRAAE